MSASANASLFTSPRRLLPALLLLLLGQVVVASPAVARDHLIKLCGHIHLLAPKRLKFTDVEVRLACGDSKNPPWADVPANQAQQFLRTFLQQRGYYHPNFDEAGDVMLVATGAATLVSRVRAFGAPPSLDISRYWQPPGEPLTPKLLNDVEDWVKHRLRATGYPCPLVSSQADPESGEVTLSIIAGPNQRIAAITSEPIPGLLPGVIRRDDAFAVGDEFNADWLDLTALRLTNQEVLLSTHIGSHCATEGAVVHQRSDPGPPRLASFGVGYNTERGPLVRGALRSGRLGPEASSMSLSLQLAERLQTATLSSDWYVLPQASRYYLQPSLSYEHDVESTFDTRTTKVRLAPAASLDSADANVKFALGPAIEVIRTTRGLGPAFSHIVGLDGDATYTTHAFEYTAQAPSTGRQFGVSTTISRKAWRSDIDATRLNVNGEQLWNIADLAPPRLVLGLRGELATTLTANSPAAFDALPPTFRHYLGSSANLRGFARESAPTGGQGALTTVYLGGEARLAAGLPAGIQPLVFCDVGKAGRQSLDLDRPLYFSPGTGLRWQSPVGGLRLTAGRGMVRYASLTERAGLERWVFYFSFGQEF